ncbi:MAG: hypothetical protein M0Z28_18230 [Rhodospirillales bacterium]|nr:hypothetical protein [Rhodospirillales bacterium]
MGAPTASEFCELIAAARHWKLKGTMTGSAFRKHPCFVLRRDILLCNEWNTNDYCFAEAFTARPVEFKPWSHDPATYGDPYPHPVNGQAIRFYSTGDWSVDGPWQQIMLDVLDELRKEIEEAKAADRSRRLQEQANAAASRAAVIATAAAAYS